MAKVFDILPPKELKPRISQKREIIERKPKAPFKKGVLIILFLLLIFTFFSFWFFQKAHLEIWPKTEIISFREKIIVDKNLKESNFLAKAIPGEFLTEGKTTFDEFFSSGKIKKEERARGIIRVYNNYHLPQLLVAQTRFQPPLEKVLYFRTTKSINVPAKGYLDVEVVADKAGSEYNIGPSTFSIPGLAGRPQYYSVYGKSFEPMKGGFIGETSQVIEKDLESADKILKEKLEKEIELVLKSKISQEIIFLEPAIKREIEKAVFSAKVGDEVDKFTGQTKGVFKALVFKKNDLENFAKDFILSKISPDQKLKEDSLDLKYLPETIDLEGGKIILNLDFSATVYRVINQDILKREIAGKSLTEARLILEKKPEIEKINFKIFPFWLKKIPKSIEKINIFLKGVKEKEI